MTGDCSPISPMLAIVHKSNQPTRIRRLPLAQPFLVGHNQLRFTRTNYQLLYPVEQQFKKQISVAFICAFSEWFIRRSNISTRSYCEIETSNSCCCLDSSKEVTILLNVLLPPIIVTVLWTQNLGSGSSRWQLMVLFLCCQCHFLFQGYFASSF